MKRALQILALALALIALAWVWLQGRQLGALARRPSETERGQGADAHPGGAAAGEGEAYAGADAGVAGDLARRVDALERRLANLERWLLLEAPSGGAATSARVVAQLREDVDALMRAVPTDPTQEREQLEATVRETLDRQRTSRHQQRLEHHQKESREAVDRFAEAAELSDGQREEMAQLYAQAQKSTHELFSSAREGERSFRELREEIRKIWGGVDERLKELLDEEELSLLEQMREEEPGLRGSPRRRPR